MRNMLGGLIMGAGLMFAATGLLAEGAVIKSHGYSFHGDLKYPADFTHLSYVNPDAPKGGEISLGASGTFDSMNAYSRKGRAGALSTMRYESLLADPVSYYDQLPADVYGERYGLLAHTVEYDEGKTWAIFYMRPEARFSDGAPVTAHDVVFSHNLFLEQGLPSYANAVKKRIWTAEALDDHTVKFTFNPEGSRRDLVNQAGGVPVFPKAWYEETGARLDEPRLDAAPGSGPYVMDSYDVNRQIIYKRNPDYWGWDLPINQGRHNFDSIRVEYFADQSASFEAFKAGEYTFRAEGNSKQWATGYEFPAVEKGFVVRETLPDGSLPVPTGVVFNLAREALKDIHVREAITLGFNFEWTNESLQFGLYKQRNSFMQDSPLMAMGPPVGEELALLQELGDLVPDALISEPAVVMHTSKATRLTDRRNLRAATKLLDAAGWAVGTDGKRRNAAGDLLTLELPYSSSSSSTLDAVIVNFAKNLEAMGVDIRPDKIDPAQFTSRRRDRDYDLLFSSFIPAQQPDTSFRQQYGSEEASHSVFNPAGVASPLVDAIIDAGLNATSKTRETAALMALDRVLRAEKFHIPVWYNDSAWVAYWDQYGHPETIPPYMLGAMDFWWYDAEKAAKLRADGALR
jgi:microcin C transport system substrate-binding protein